MLIQQHLKLILRQKKSRLKVMAGLTESEGEWLSEESGWTPMARVMRADDSTEPITGCATYVQADGGKNSQPQWRFGTQERFAGRVRGKAPGPGCASSHSTRLCI